MADRLKPLVDWMYHEIQGIEEVLRKLAPNLRIINGEVATFPSIPAADQAPVQRAPNDPAAGRAWADLPSIQRSIGTPPLVAPAAPFKAELAGATAPAPILAPLSHGRSLEAPRGIVVGVARPTQVQSAPALPAPVQRSPLGPARRGSGEAGAPVFADSTTDAGITAPAPSASVVGPATPLRQLPVADATPPRSAHALTVAPEPNRAPLVGLVAQPRARGQGTEHTTATRPEAPAAVQRAPIEPAGPGPGPVPVAARAHDAPRLTIGQARRLGLGAPIGGGPVSPGAPAAIPAQRAPVDPAAASAAPSPAAVPPAAIERAPAETLDMPLAATSRGRDTAGDAHEEPSPQRSAEPASAISLPLTTAPPVVARPVGSSLPGGDAPAAGRPSPIISSRPLRIRVQRAPLTLPQRAGDEQATGSASALPAPKVPPPGGPVTIHRGSEAGALSKSLDARSFTHGGEIFMPDSHGPLTAGKGKALLAHELTHVVQQRRLGSSLPGEHTPAGKALESEAAAAEHAPDMTLATPRRPDTHSSPAAPATSAASAGADPSSAADPHAGHGHGTGPGPQRAPVSDREASRPGGETRRTSGGGAGPAQGHSEQELEVLAHQLYQRIGRHLRRELLVDRERAGFALDLP